VIIYPLKEASVQRRFANLRDKSQAGVVEREGRGEAKCRTEKKCTDIDGHLGHLK